jgi:hypothetical protein
MVRGKTRKPSGRIGPTMFSFGHDGPKAEFQPIPFPKTKEEIEAFIVQGFLRAAQQQGILQSPSLSASQNELNDFDFSLTTPSGNKSLELMEIALLEHLRGAYDKAPLAYKSYEFAQYILKKLKGKSDRYTTSTGAGLLLLMYITDWRFIMSDTVIALLQYWTLKDKHSFEGIFCYSPITPQDGIAHLIYPTPHGFWRGFNPELYQNNISHNLDPADWSTGSK